MKVSNVAVCISLLAASLCASAGNAAVSVSMVTVRDPGAAADTTGFGEVDYVYRIGKFDVTVNQYCEFLNAVARTDTYGLYSQYMADISPEVAGCNIQRMGSSGGYVYFVGDGGPTDVANWGNRPVGDVSWGDAARFCNWLSNGQPSGLQNTSTTEDGSYFLNGATTDIELAAVTRKAKVRYVIPTEDEWYKAAYYDQGMPVPGYRNYPTRSDIAPLNILDPAGTNNANFRIGLDYTVGAPYFRTDVGAFASSLSYYGTFDQGGNVWQWNEAVFSQSTYRGVRGGSYSSVGADTLAATFGAGLEPSYESADIGFRVAALEDDARVKFENCASGPEVAYAQGCADQDLDVDGDVDSDDFGIFQRTFISGLPTVTTKAVSSITGETAESGGEVIDEGSEFVTKRGVCWNTAGMPTTDDEPNITDDGEGAGSFTSSLIGLIAGTKYYVRAYATSDTGTAYGEQREFTASATPTVTTTAITNIRGTAATSGGNVISQGTQPVTVRGVCWSTETGPTVGDINDWKTTNGSGLGSFASELTGLTTGTKYYVRAYATNSVDTSYGQEREFTTASLPTVTTSAVPPESVTGYAATCGGNVTADGGVAVTVRGVCWNTTGNPTTADAPNITYDGTGTGGYTSNLEGLTPDTTYYVRAYATNFIGTAYGVQTSFTTVAMPIITTAAISNLTGDTATCGGNVTSEGDQPVTVRGVCWNTTGMPTTADAPNITEDGEGLGVFTSSLTGLVVGTKYYVRAYATCSLGTVYGQQVIFLNAPLTFNMATIVAGDFLMGDAFSEAGVEERPVHNLTIDEYLIGRYEVTTQEYVDGLNWAIAQVGLIMVGDGVTGVNGVVYKATSTSYPYCSTTSAPAGSPNYGEYSQITWDSGTSTFAVVAGKEDYPVVLVSWYGSAAYANWRSGMEGKPVCYDLATWTCNWGLGYRLPTEAEWEKAARGGAEGRRFPWADTDNIQHVRANYYSSASHAYDTSATRGYHPTFITTTFPYTNPVGYFDANDYGLYDMAGNAWEWCNDFYSSSYYSSSPASNPHGPATGTYHVLRGGAWSTYANMLRCSYRLGTNSSDKRFNSVGFRLAINAEQ